MYEGSYYFVSGIAPGNDLKVFLPVPNLIGYEGSGVCTPYVSNPPCSAYGYIFTDACGSLSGSLTPVSTTAVSPEPSSIALLGTGVLGLAGVVRKSFA